MEECALVNNMGSGGKCAIDRIRDSKNKAIIKSNKNGWFKCKV